MRLILWAVFLSSALIAFGSATRQATAVATVANGGVIGITLTDGGEGYTRPPAITLEGAGGSGAYAVSRISAGKVTEVIVIQKGHGFTNSPVVVMDQPKVSGLIGIHTLPVLIMTNSVGLTMQISYTESVESGNWTVLTNLQVRADPETFIDQSALGKPVRFYKTELNNSIGGKVPSTLTVHATGGPFAGNTFKLWLRGGITGEFTILEGSEGRGFYSFNETESGATLTLTYLSLANERDIMNLVFASTDAGTFTGSLVTYEAGSWNEYSDYSGTFRLEWKE